MNGPDGRKARCAYCVSAFAVQASKILVIGPYRNIIVTDIAKMEATIADLSEMGTGIVNVEINNEPVGWYAETMVSGTYVCVFHSYRLLYTGTGRLR